MKRFILILQFLTRIPVNLSIDVKEGDFGKGIVYFPIVGFIIGLLNLLVYLFISYFLREDIAKAFVVLFNVLVTGGLHLDGLADTCDGIFSARSKERMLEIMRDSRIGTNGSIAIFFDLFLRWILLNNLNSYQSMKVIVIAPIISRALMSLVIYKAPYARPGEGLGKLFIGHLNLSRTLITLIIGCGLSFAILKISAVIIIFFNIILVYLYRKYITKKIGGMTGDTLGAWNELSEIVVLMIFICLKGMN